MQFLKIDSAIGSCELHLTETNSFGTEIEKMLTSSVLILICCEFELAIKNMLHEKCRSVLDKDIKNFVETCIGLVFRSLTVKEMTGLLGKFDSSNKEVFSALCQQNERAVTFYGNIITNRNAAAHEGSSSSTFLELKNFYAEGHVILDFFRQALSSQVA